MYRIEILQLFVDQVPDGIGQWYFQRVTTWCTEKILILYVKRNINI